MVPFAGAWVTESIELIAPIAEGAMGKVWVAYHHRLKTRVAVKFVHDKVAGEDILEARARFEQEASMAAQIKSPNVVQTYDSGMNAEGAPYIVMELLEGQSLGDRLRGAGPLGWNEAATIIAQVARARTKAHELGIVHRDIKPDNIFLCRSDDGILCKVLDFGVAKQTRLPAMGGLTTDGKVVGTPEFMSPEMVLEDDPVDYRADLWALGVVMYVGITGQLPYNGKTLGQLCLNLVNRRPTSPSMLRLDLPPAADEWFTRALNRDPAQRFATARDMAVTFANVTGGANAVADLQSPTLLASALPNSNREARFSLPPGSRPEQSRGSFAKPLVATLGVAGLLLLGGAGAVLTRSPARLPSPPSPTVAEPTLAREAAVESATAPEPETSAEHPMDTPPAPPGGSAAPQPSTLRKAGPLPTVPLGTAPPKPSVPKAPGERDLGF